ncbi:MAG: hypothetical protein AB8G95_20500 [Anaerolineae bacterium]
MDKQFSSAHNKFATRILFCILPTLALIFVALGADAAPNKISIVEDQSSVALKTTSQLTSTTTMTLSLPLMFGAPIAAPDVTISRPTASGPNYVWNLTWNQSEEPDGATYTVFESTSPDMIPILKQFTVSSRAATITRPATTDNIYYYSVRLNHPNAKSSDPIRVVSAYRDDFNDPSSGWATRRQDFDETDNVMTYENGNLKMHVRGRWDYFITSSLAEAPAPPYRITTRVKFDGPGNLNTYGLIFGGDNNGGACPTIFASAGRSVEPLPGDAEFDVFDAIPDGVRAPSAANNTIDNCLNSYFRMMFLWKDGFGEMHAELKEIYFHTDNNSGRGFPLSGDDFLELPVSSRSANDWNEWSAEVYPDGTVIIYSGVDRVYQNQTDKEFLINGTAFGLWASTDEYPGSDPLYDYILVEPIGP